MRPSLLLPALLLLGLQSVLAQSSATTQAPEPAGTSYQGPTSPQELGGFLDVFFEEQMETLHVPGAVFVMVQDSAVFFKKGYGYANVDARTPVDPDETLFQVASVSKLFTATAVMQLVEQGRVDLHADINQYLRQVQIEAAFGEPVTLAHLLTHTAGFDERNIGYAARDAASVRPLGAYLADRMPPRTLPPGTVTSYSNHGFGLAGHVVEAVSGEPFEAYMKTHLFDPLVMTQSTFRLPLPAPLALHLATGYRWTGDAFEPVPLLYRNVPPAGALSTTASDIAHFMIAFLQYGHYGDRRILDEATVREMHRQQFTHHPRLPGMAYGFIELPVNGYRALQHGGDSPGYRSLLFLLPDQNAGFFVASNALSQQLRKQLVMQFMDRYYPVAVDVELLQPNAATETHLERYIGTYLLNRYGRRSLEKLLALFNASFYVGSDSEGYLVTQGGERWAEVEPLLFRHAEKEDYLAFREDDRGRITHLFRSIDVGGTFPAAYEKLAWYETPTFANEFYLSWIPFLLITWIIWPMGAVLGFLWRRWKHRPRPKRTPGMHIARWVAALFGVGTIWFAAGFIQKALRQVEQGGGELLYGMPASMDALLWIPIVQGGLLVVMGFFTIQAWRSAYWSVAGRVHYTVFTTAALAWMIFAAKFNLIGHLY